MFLMVLSIEAILKLFSWIIHIFCRPENSELLLDLYFVVDAVETENRVWSFFGPLAHSNYWIL